MVAVRDMPKAITCISLGRGETSGTASMSLPVGEGMADDLYSAGSKIEQKH